jgi:hypothetical protein
MLPMSIWMVNRLQYGGERCSVPVSTWVYAAFLFADIYQIIVIFILTSLARGLQAPAPTQFKVRVYKAAIAGFILGLSDATVLWWIAGSKSGSVPRACYHKVQESQNELLVCGLFHLGLTLFVHVHMVGLEEVVRLEVLARRVAKRSISGAPKGALERNTETVGPDDAVFQEVPQCAVCLQDFCFDCSGQSNAEGRGADREHVLRTKPCRHVFHQQCLKEWMLVNRTCPLCRVDLGDLGAAGSHCTHGQCIPPQSTAGMTVGLASLRAVTV